jgi:hypothetical protein
MRRYVVRLTRFNDASAFRNVTQFLADLSPGHSAADVEAALARLPCAISHDAEEVAAEALREALERRGAAVKLMPLDAVDTNPKLKAVGAVNAVNATQELSPEIDLSFLADARKKAKAQATAMIAGSARAPAVPQVVAKAAGRPQKKGKAPWEE